jgi:argininosuccinate lyase
MTKKRRAQTLWLADAAPDAQMLAYTVADDREVDAHLLEWDVYGSLGHLEGLRRSRLVKPKEYAALRRGLLQALDAVAAGALRIGTEHEDGHSALELWLTRRLGEVGERVHTGRSRNDQVATALRLFLKARVLAVHGLGCELAAKLVRFARSHSAVLVPGYTHQRRAMPSSVGAWALGLAEGLLAALDGVHGFWSVLDRSPLGSAAGYGVPLPLNRRIAAKALGFADLDHVVTVVQNGRGKLEAAALFWCSQIGHELAKLSADVILFSSDEFGWLGLPHDLSTGSSIMPHKRNPDLFELTRARAATLDGELSTILHLRGKLPSGYHRDFQFLKAPLVRGLSRTEEMLAMLGTALPRLRVDRLRAAEALTAEVFATDEVMRRVRDGETFRAAYRDVAARVKRGEATPRLTPRELLAARRSEGALGNLGMRVIVRRLSTRRAWERRAARAFSRALRRLRR